MPPAALQHTVDRARGLYEQPDAWQRMMRQAMMRGFDWSRSGERYARTYRQALAHRVQAGVVRPPESLDEPPSLCVCHRLQAVVRPQLAVDVVQVIAEGLRRNA